MRNVATINIHRGPKRSVDGGTHCMRFTRYASCVNRPIDSTRILVNAAWAPSVDIAENRPLVALPQSSRSGASQSAANVRQIPKLISCCTKSLMETGSATVPKGLCAFLRPTQDVFKRSSLEHHPRIVDTARLYVHTARRHYHNRHQRAKMKNTSSRSRMSTIASSDSGKN